MIRIWIRDLKLFEKWVLSPSSPSNIAEIKGVYGGKWSCILTFKNGKKAMVQVK